MIKKQFLELTTMDRKVFIAIDQICAIIPLDTGRTDIELTSGASYMVNEYWEDIINNLKN